MLILLFLLQSTPSMSSFPSGWAIVGWIVAGLIGVIYLFSGVLQNLSTGRKELLDVSKEKYANLVKEKDEADFRIKEILKQVERLEKEKAEIEKDKTMLMREHHQLLEISVADLNTLKSNAKLIEQLEEEVNRYREEKGLPPKTRIVTNTRNDL